MEASAIRGAGRPVLCKDNPTSHICWKQTLVAWSSLEFGRSDQVQGERDGERGGRRENSQLSSQLADRASPRGRGRAQAWSAGALGCEQRFWPHRRPEWPAWVRAAQVQCGRETLSSAPGCPGAAPACLVPRLREHPQGKAVMGSPLQKAWWVGRLKPEGPLGTQILKGVNIASLLRTKGD